MTEAFKHRDVAAPRVAEEVPAVVHHTGDRHGHHHDHHHPSLARRGLSAAACCCRCRARSGSSRRRERRCCPSLLPLFSRKNTRHFSALVLLFLAGTFSLRGWRASMMIDSTPLGVGRWSTSSAGLAKDQRSQCEWEPGGPVMFDVRHSKTHADGERNTRSERGSAVLSVNHSLCPLSTAPQYCTSPEWTYKIVFPFRESSEDVQHSSSSV